MLLYILRHAWAEDRSEEDWANDRLRKLTAEGYKRFKCVARKLVAAGCEPRLIATSPLVRCRQTADILAQVAPGAPPVIELESLAPCSDLTAMLRWTAEQHLDSVAWVGHAPDVSELTACLLGDRQMQLRFAKGACAAIRFDDRVEAGRGTLQWFATAKLLDC